MFAMEGEKVSCADFLLKTSVLIYATNSIWRFCADAEMSIGPNLLFRVAF